jgi:DNA repair protein RadA/Sms
MAKLRTIHRCTDCGAAAPQWVGRCPTCGEWNTLVEEVDEVQTAGAARGAGLPLGLADRPVPIADVDTAGWSVRPTGVGELDRVLGGGLVPGSVTLVGGEPGIGKSTLLLQALASTAAGGAKVLLVSAEESKEQVRLRAQRLGTLAPTLWLLSETNLAGILLAVAEVEPELLVVDSIQTVFDPELGSTPGSVTQVRGCAQQLVTAAKERGMATVLVGHVTKDGGLAGPRLLEHLVDTVLSFEGDRHHALRLLRAVKHRYGATGELGLFEMGDVGMVGVPDPSGLFLGDRRAGVPGSVVVPAIEGHRPLLVEIQALVADSSLAMPRRSALGVDSGRLSLLTAVLEKRVGVALGKDDVYASAVGGVRVVEPAADLGLALAMVSSKKGRLIPADLVACGEVGLAGEIRQVSHTARRLAEAARLGFTAAVVPPSAPEPPAGMTAIRVPTLRAAVREMGLIE